MAHIFLGRQGLQLTPIRVFLDYFMNVRDATLNKSRSRRDLSFLTREKLKRSQVTNLWDYLSANKRGGTLTWLNGRFEDKQGIWSLFEGDYVRLGEISGRLFEVEKLLEPFLDKDGYVPLERNAFNG